MDNFEWGVSHTCVCSWTLDLLLLYFIFFQSTPLPTDEATAVPNEGDDDAYDSDSDSNESYETLDRYTYC